MLTVGNAVARCPLPAVGPQSPSDSDYADGFAAALMLKDRNLAMEAAQSVDANTPMGKRATEIYQAFADAGQGGLDFSAIIKSLNQN